MERTVSVTGAGSAAAVPDAVVIRVTAVGRARDVGDAFSRSDSTVRALMGAATRHTGEHQVATSGVQVWTDHDQQGVPRGFLARHSLRISVDDVGVAGALLSDLVTAGGDGVEVEGVDLVVSDPGPAMRAAREAAFADARERAGHLATLAGASLGDVVSITEHGGYAPRPAAHAAKAMGVMDAALAPGESRVTASVVVVFALG